MQSISNIALTLVAFLGALITLLSLIGVMRPRRLVQLVNATWHSPGSWWLAVGIRVIAGVALITCAQASLLPRAFVVLGWLMLLSALMITLAGRERITRLLRWFSELQVIWMRAWCTVGAVFGASLVYGVMGPA